MHGTPVEVNAKKAGKDPETFANEFWQEHQKDFASYEIVFDNYYKTHSPENKELAEYFYSTLKKKKLIYRKKIDAIYCPQCKRYLPDRYVKGACPHCQASDQYGDICEKCSSVLKGTDLVNPYCSLCRTLPIKKESEHYFFALSKLSSKLQTWMNDPKSKLQPEVKNWLQEWMNKGLEDWCISRDAPYFGFEIPNSKKETGEVKYFYVWLDAPIGYISSTKNYCDRFQQKWKDYWYKGHIQHFIGKDIAYFHFLFWPAMLLAVGIPLPKLTVHGFITVNGQKMSKSRGTFFTAKDFLKLYPAEALRFFYANHLDRKVIDVDLNFNDFQALNNNVLVGSLGNFCYRVLTFAQKNYGAVSKVKSEKELNDVVKKSIALTQQYYAEQDFRAAIKEIIALADVGNAYFQKAEPWKNKDDPATQEAVAWCVNLARTLAVISNPVLPVFSRKVYHIFGNEELTWNDAGKTWKGKLSPVEMLVQKIETLPPTETFLLHLTVGQILEVKDHPNADSLYLLTVNLGNLGKRPVVAGIKKYFTKESLLHKKAVFCANMKLAKIRGELSQAMILVADDGKNVSLLEVSKTNVGENVQFGDLTNSTSEVTYEEFKKLTLLVKNGAVTFEGRTLKTRVEEIRVKGVQQGAKIM